MSYGCGNYMVRGDPGFFGNLFHAVTGVIGGAVGGFIKGGPLGGIAGALGGAVHATASNIGSSTLEAGGSATALTPQLRASHAAALARGTPAMHAAAAGRAMPGAGGGGGGGFHPAKDGSGRMVRNRSMNWANHRALGRAERRIRSAVKHFSRYIRWVHPGRKGHAAPAFGRRRKKK